MPVFRTAYRLVKCKFCKGKGGPSSHMDEPGEMIVEVCCACKGLMYNNVAYQVHFVTDRFPTHATNDMIHFPSSIRMCSNRNAARLCLGCLKEEIFKEQMTKAAFNKVRKKLFP